MAKISDHQLRKNALRGAITTWCPLCKRKAALGQPYSGGAITYRKCRYCGHFEYRNAGKRKLLYNQWEESKGEQDGR